MATPKKRTSKTRKNLRKAQWKAKAGIEAKKALSTAKKVLKTISNQASNDQINEFSA
jgi:large subunit ribosomal protein L32